MTQMTNYLEKKLLDHTLGLAAYTMPTTVWLGLSTSDPGETASLTGEPSGNGYARQDLTAAMGVTNATTGVSVNEDVISFGPCVTTPWGTITHVLVSDDDGSPAGNGMLFGPLSSSRAIAVNDSLQLAASAFSITFA